MGVRTTSSENVVALHDSVTGWAFGPVFHSEEEADDFLIYASTGPDLRILTDDELMEIYKRWYAVWTAERGCE